MTQDSHNPTKIVMPFIISFFDDYRCYKLIIIPYINTEVVAEDSLPLLPQMIVKIRVKQLDYLNMEGLFLAT